jgi:hypothetical protein
MLSLISGAIGLITGVLPDLIRRWQDHADKAHELKLFALQLEQQRLGHKYKVEEIGIEADIRETEALYETQKPLQATGPWERFWNGLNASVRPVITYMLVTFYMAYKYSMLLVIRKEVPDAQIPEVLFKLYTADDMAFLCLILGFWFGSRQLGKLMDKAKGKWF